MKSLKSEVGSSSVLLITTIVSSVLFVVAIVFGLWAFMERQDYKNNVDEKIQTAVQVAVDKSSTEKDNEFIEREKIPTRTYKGSTVLGSVTFNYPKTWSGYYKETDNTLLIIMQFGLVNGIEASKYPLRVEVLDSKYTDNLRSFEDKVKTGKLKASAFRLEKLSDVLGTRFDGQIDDNGTKGAVILLPQREKTVKISAESQEAVPDLNNIILPSFKFTP